MAGQVDDLAQGEGTIRGIAIRPTALILGDAPFANFIAMSDWLYAKTDATHRIALDRLAALVVEWLGSRGLAAETVAEALATDYAGQAHKLHVKQKAVATAKAAKSDAVPQRQARHLAA